MGWTILNVIIVSSSTCNNAIILKLQMQGRLQMRYYVLNYMHFVDSYQREIFKYNTCEYFRLTWYPIQFSWNHDRCGSGRDVADRHKLSVTGLPINEIFIFSSLNHTFSVYSLSDWSCTRNGLGIIRYRQLLPACCSSLSVV